MILSGSKIHMVLCPSGTFGLTWAEWLRLRCLARCERNFCLRYLVRALGLWAYGWYMMTRAWEISQAYEAVQGVCRFCAMRLDCHKNSDLGSEVRTVTGLNSTTLRLIESVALLTKSIGIVTPLILSIIVVVALRLISYMKQPRDHIVHRLLNRSLLYMGFVMRGRE